MTVHILYRFYDINDVLLYVGITNNPQRRLISHSHTQPWFRKIKRAEFEHFQDRGELMDAEIMAIRTEHPKYNRVHSVTPEPPQIGITHRPRVRNTIGRHSHRFTPSDAIADDDYISPEEVERRLSEAETHGAKGLTRKYPVMCPGCGAPNVYEHYDGIIACALCPQMWSMEEFQASRVGISYELKAYP